VPSGSVEPDPSTSTARPFVGLVNAATGRVHAAGSIDEKTLMASFGLGDAG